MAAVVLPSAHCWQLSAPALALKKPRAHGRHCRSLVPDGARFSYAPAKQGAECAAHTLSAVAVAGVSSYCP